MSRRLQHPSLVGPVWASVDLGGPGWAYCWVWQAGQFSGRRGAARHAGKPHFLSGPPRKPQGGGPDAGRMAEGKASGAAGLFAKQVQKKFSRAQEKVGRWAGDLRSWP